MDCEPQSNSNSGCTIENQFQSQSVVKPTVEVMDTVEQVCTVESVTITGDEEESLLGDTAVDILPNTIDMIEILQGETELQEDSDGLSLKSMDDDQQPDVGKPAEQLAGSITAKEDLDILSSYLLNLITWGPCRANRAELLALADQLVRVRKIHPGKIDRHETDVWGQLIMDMSTMGDQYPGLEWRRAAMWESFLRERDGAISRILSFDPSISMPKKIARFYSLTSDMIKTDSAIPVNWARILDGFYEQPRYKQPRTPGLVRLSNGFKTRSTSPLPGFGRGHRAAVNNDTLDITLDNIPSGSKRTHTARNPDPLDHRIGNMLSKIAELKTNHFEKLDEIDRNLKVLKTKRISVQMKFDDQEQRLEKDLKKAQLEKRREVTERAKRAAVQPSTPSPDTTSLPQTPEPNQSEGLDAKIRDLRATMAELVEKCNYTSGTTNLLEVTGWEMNALLSLKLPPAPDYLVIDLQRTDEGLMKANAFPNDLAKSTARKVNRAVADVLDCAPKTIRETVNVLRRLATVLQLLGCETCRKLTNESRTTQIEELVPLKVSKAKPSRAHRHRIRVASIFVRNRSNEFIKAVERMILGLNSHDEQDRLAQHLSRFVPAMQGLLSRLWWITHLDRTIDNKVDLKPVQHYHCD